MFLFIILFIASLIVLSKNAANIQHTFKLGKTTWTLTTDKEVWPASGDVEYTIFYEAETPDIQYCDERWALKCNGKINMKYLVKTCWYQVKQQRDNFKDALEN